MKRDKAKELFSKRKSDFIIDKMYDYFESRTCENCKYNYYDREDAILLCTNEDNNQEYLHNSEMQITLDFCCNKWEVEQ